LFRGRVFSVARHRAVEPGGICVVREVIHHPGSAVILPLLDDGRVLLVRQFRFAAGQSLWELPAGTRNRDETALATARRELAEETGYRAASWGKLIDFYPSPGILDETMTLFLARKIRPGAASPEGDERIRVEPFARAEWQRMIRSGQIRDAKTLVGLLYWQWMESGM
jgi:ADP-ribose pyrophosphatase